MTKNYVEENMNTGLYMHNRLIIGLNVDKEFYHKSKKYIHIKNSSNFFINLYSKITINVSHGILCTELYMKKFIN